MIPDWLNLVHATATWTMVGVILVVQVVVYPQFLAVGAAEFRTYHARHMRRISRVVGLPMTAEAVSAAALAFLSPADALAWTGLALVAAIWIHTVLLEIPLHRQISASGDRNLMHRLVRVNAVRAGLWVARGAVAVALLHADAAAA